MKRNIDLTQDRIFSNDWLDDLVTSVLTVGLLTGEKIPWNANITELEPFKSENDETPLIAIGNKEDRSKEAFRQRMINREHCERCGDKLHLHPWDKNIGLCDKCNKSLDETYGDRCKWRTTDIIRNAIIRTS